MATHPHPSNITSTVTNNTTRTLVDSNASFPSSKIVKNEEEKNTTTILSHHSPKVMPKKHDTPSWIKTGALCLLVAQNVSLVMTMKESMGENGAPYIVTVAVFLTEFLKLIICVIVIYFYQKQTFNWMSLVRVEGLKMAVPALLYVFQNNMLFFAVSRLEPAVFQVTYQLKIATTAMFSVLMLKRTLTRAQWVGVALLLPGVCLVQLSRLTGADSDPVALSPGAGGGGGGEGEFRVLNNVGAPSAAGLFAGNEIGGGSGGGGGGGGGNELNAVPAAHSPHVVPFFDQVLGFVAVTVSCVTSGFAGVYFEKVLKSASKLSLWERNVQLAAYSIVIAFVTIVLKDFSRVVSDGPLVGMSFSSCMVIVLQAAGGLVIAVVVRYTDNIAKAFATSVSVIISCILSIFFFDFRPSLGFFSGAFLVGCAVRFYSSKPDDWLINNILVKVCRFKANNPTSILP